MVYRYHEKLNDNLAEVEQYYTGIWAVFQRIPGPTPTEPNSEVATVMEKLCNLRRNFLPLQRSPLDDELYFGITIVQKENLAGKLEALVKRANELVFATESVANEGTRPRARITETVGTASTMSMTDALIYVNTVKVIIGSRDVEYIPTAGLNLTPAEYPAAGQSESECKELEELLRMGDGEEDMLPDLSVALTADSSCSTIDSDAFGARSPNSMELSATVTSYGSIGFDGASAKVDDVGV